MAFEKELPQWKEKGVKPPQSKLDEGWKVQDKPPASWLNWQMNKTYEALKEVQEKAAEKEHVQAAKITRDDGTAQLAPDRDINNWNKLGVYSFNEAHVSKPNGFVRGLIFVYEDEEGVTYQMAWKKDGHLSVRTKNEVGKWNEWGGMVASDELDKILAGYMHKTGGDFDGSVGFPGYGSIMKFTHGTGDNATYDVYNNALRVHWGLAMKTYDESVTGLWDSRTGRWITKGGFSVQRGSGNEKWNVDLSGSQTMDGSLNVKGGATIQGDGPVLTLKGTTHQYINFFAKQSGNRSGYIGASDPNNPGNLAVVSDGGFLVLKGTQGVMVNDRNILIELDQLKKSGVDAKNRIAGAINAKGVPASANDSFDQLAGKIGQIYTGLPVAKISKSLSSYKLTFRSDSIGGRSMYFVVVTGLGFRAKRITIQESSSVFPIAVCDVDKDPGIVWSRSLEPGEYDQKFLVKFADKLPDYSPSNLGWWEGTITQDGFIMPVTFSDYLAEREMYVVAIG